MGLQEKKANAKKSDWITQGFTDDDIKTLVELAQISATIERRRIELGMTQVQFADFMGVSQGMISKWEGRDYNFTIKSLNYICNKIGLDFKPIIEYQNKKPDFKLVKFVDKLDSSKANWINSIDLDKTGEIA